MRTDAFDFDLPEALIALAPARPRERARLLHAPVRGPFGDLRVSDLPALVRPGDVLVVNDTKVIAAALNGARASRQAGAPPVRIEALLHKREDAATWRAFAKPLKRLREGETIAFGGSLNAIVVERAESDIVLKFDRAGEALDAAIAAAGAPPLPPYIAGRRARSAEDADDYQTMFAQRSGAVAAPTAGLHFTPALLDQVRSAGADVVSITLHVGAGTFMPVKTETVDGHTMHSEWRSVSPDAAHTLNAARTRGGRIIAIGTTALRSLESAADASGEIHACSGDTDIFITPGYRFRAIDLLWTNFHLPRSTLFMLVAAFAGLERAHAAYAHAIAHAYRFYSFGDACLFERADA
ncbi:MAG: tRNA preQ1(34) S-adenosylmethionine ribosyltransferase-isomerase QueA [Alphaproteobacteria bacterium]|nr:tRNA preQ1(34) S-adenosylmethionine ribosyltransferase-isomerase QueA [Alphaproteobacteria bacterium]